MGRGSDLRPARPPRLGCRRPWKMEYILDLPSPGGSTTISVPRPSSARKRFLHAYISSYFVTSCETYLVSMLPSLSGRCPAGARTLHGEAQEPSRKYTRCFVGRPERRVPAV